MSKQAFRYYHSTGEANPVYCYHPDHLGTSNALTDANGTMYQFFLNVPFGEPSIASSPAQLNYKAKSGQTMASQSSTSYYQSEFKFNGKELDTETGLYYYGARYFDPSLSIWLSVDPLAEQFPNFSPYNYTMNNPINMVDPDGRAPSFNESPIYGSDGSYRGNTVEGFKGNVIIYDGDLNFKQMTERDLMIATGNTSNCATYFDDANLSVRAMAYIYSGIIGEVDGVDRKKLNNNNVSVYKDGKAFNITPINGVRYVSAGLFSYTPSTGDINVNYDVYSKYFTTTVENIQNHLGVHEFIGHKLNRYGDGDHSHAAFLQMDHSSWDNMTNNSKGYVVGIAARLYLEETGKQLNTTKYATKLKKYRQYDPSNGNLNGIK